MSCVKNVLAVIKSKFVCGWIFDITKGYLNGIKVPHIYVYIIYYHYCV